MVETRNDVLVPRVCGRSRGFIVAKSYNISMLFVWEEMGETVINQYRVSAYSLQISAHAHTHILPSTQPHKHTITPTPTHLQPD